MQILHTKNNDIMPYTMVSSAIMLKKKDAL